MTSREPTIALLGTINFDRVVTERGETFESLGGILYNAMALAAIFDDAPVRVRIASRVGGEHLGEVRDLLGALASVDPRGLLVSPSGTNLSLLEYVGEGVRRERVELRAAPLTFDEVSFLADSDLILVNMISGQDIALADLRSLRKISSAHFFLDVQALARTLESPRVPRTVDDWREWAALFHTVRGNEAEVTAFAGGAPDSETAAWRILAAGAEVVLVTAGELGSRVFCAGDSPDDPPWATSITAYPREHCVDVTGCGDSYDAAYCAGRLARFSPIDAARFASFLGSEVAGVSGLPAIHRLRGVRSRAASQDPKLAGLTWPWK